MKISEHAIIIKATKFQENSLIIDCFSREHGMLRGLLKGRKAFQMATPCALVHIILKSRLEAHLGMMQVESIRNYASLIGFDRLKLRLINCVLMLCRNLLHERDAHPVMYDSLLVFLESLCDESDTVKLLKSYALLELEIMTESGYGLDLTKCVASNDTHNLIYISPKSGCAISENMGKPYHDKLFMMPAFYLDATIPGDYDNVACALQLNEFFLRKRIFDNCNMRMPEERQGLSNLLNTIKAA